MKDDTFSDPLNIARFQREARACASLRHSNIVEIYDIDEYKGKPYKDSDLDGMPDAWEKKYGLNPKDASDAVKDCNGDGYTNIEKYINGINPKKKIDWTDLSNNYDTLTEKKGQLMK